MLALTAVGASLGAQCPCWAAWGSEGASPHRARLLCCWETAPRAKTAPEILHVPGVRTQTWGEAPAGRPLRPLHLPATLWTGPDLSRDKRRTRWGQEKGGKPAQPRQGHRATDSTRRPRRARSKPPARPGGLLPPGEPDLNVPRGRTVSLPVYAAEWRRGGEWPCESSYRQWRQLWARCAVSGSQVRLRSWGSQPWGNGHDAPLRVQDLSGPPCFLGAVPRERGLPELLPSILPAEQPDPGC